MKTAPDQLEIMPFSDEHADELARSLSEWQKTPSFNSFLKEVPMTSEENLRFVKSKLSSKESFAHVARISNRIVGILFLHGFDESRWSLEESIRIDPTLARCGIGTRLKREALPKAFEHPGVERVLSWHSAFNSGTFATNRRCGGRIVDFVESQTFLPNLWKITDDFLWEITQVKNVDPEIENVPLEESRKETILAGLRKHGFLR